MRDLFGREGRAALAALARQRTLYAFDFDGTLAPIVARPDDARARPATVALLAALTRRVPTLLLTGRGVDDLRARLDVRPSYIVGNHGAEGMPDALADPDALAAHRAIVEGWRAQWARALPDDAAGVAVEPKAYSLSIHYRAATDTEAARRAIGAAIDRLAPRPRVIAGKCVFNLLPDGAPDKGHALRALVAHAGCTAAFFVGDDITDEAAFAVAPPSWVTVRVGAADDSAARYFIADQDAIDACLTILLDETRDAG